MIRTVREITSELIASGLTADQIALVTELAVVAASGNSGGIPVDKTAEKRRAYDRERKSKSRDSGGSPVEFRGIPESASSLKKEKEEADREKSGGQTERRKQGRALTDDWRPSEGHYAEGAALRRTRDQVDAKADEMRLWAKANGHRAVARKLDWDATFLGWMRRDWGKPNGAGPPPRRGAVQLESEGHIEGII